MLKYCQSVCFAAVWLLSVFVTGSSYGQSIRADVVIYGATPAGLSAAVNAAEKGATVALFEESNQIGGMMSGGLSYTDFRTFESLQGTFRDYMERVETYYRQTYGPDSKQVKDCFRGTMAEPHVTRRVFANWLAEYPRIRVFTRHALRSTTVGRTQNKRPRLTGMTVQNLVQNRPVMVQGKVFVDATYEGDLMAKAGCAYRLGRESRQAYGEMFAGKIYYHDQKFWLGTTGLGDKAIQAYNFRVCLTDSAANQRPIPRPARYDSSVYEPLLTAIGLGRIRRVMGQIVEPLGPLPNRKYDVNDKHFAGSLSLSRPGWSHTWPEANSTERGALFERHKTYTLGLFYFLQHDARMPDSLRREAQRWGLPNDEYVDNDQFTPAIYVREGRRLVGTFTFTEQHSQQAPNALRGHLQPDAVAVGDYGLNSHGCNAPDTYHPTIRDGAFSLYYSNLAYQIPYGVMVPRDLDGLLVPVAVSASHVGFSALRYEPTWVALGQAAGLAAAQAIQQKRAVRQVNVPSLQADLHQQGASTIYFSDVARTSPDFVLTQFFGSRGYFHDVPEWGAVPFVNHLNFIQGQYTTAFPYHAAELDQPMNDRLTDRWLKRSGSTNAALSTAGQVRTRREFLQQLYTALHP